VQSSWPFQITSGPNGSPCPGAALPFAPSLDALMTDPKAGAFSPLSTTFSRADGNQNLQAISLKMPPGLSGLLTGVELCPEPQANQGTCGPNSLIGETTVSVGVGGKPFSVKGGRVYMTGPYGGAPFGLSIVNPAKAGPYDLEAGTPCDCVLVRAKIEVDPITSALTITTDNSGPYKIPTILKGIPLEIQHVNVTVTRPGFTAASVVGHAKAITPLIPVPLEGPAYFVSHGGEAFPSLIVVLQGYGVTVDLVGTTFISKAGITSSTFKTIPDVPVGTFELNLPEGKYSALAANGNLCTSKLAMPTSFVAQNGAVIKQSTPIAVTGRKPAISVVGYSGKRSHASIRVTVPSAGTLVATGMGIKRSIKRVAKAGTVTMGVTLTSHDLRVLAKNPHQRVNAKVELRFRPTHGAPLTAYVTLLMG
jgi:hypothetical protein